MQCAKTLKQHCLRTLRYHSNRWTLTHEHNWWVCGRDVNEMWRSSRASAETSVNRTDRTRSTVTIYVDQYIWIGQFLPTLEASSILQVCIAQNVCGWCTTDCDVIKANRSGRRLANSGACLAVYGDPSCGSRQRSEMMKHMQQNTVNLEMKKWGYSLLRGTWLT